MSFLKKDEVTQSALSYIVGIDISQDGKQQESYDECLLISIFYGSQFYNSRFGEEIFYRYREIIIKEINKTLESHNTSPAYISCITSISNLLESFLKTLDKVCDIEHLSLIGNGVIVEPTEI